MRIVIKDIIDVLKVSEETAKKIEFQMEVNGVDFSEISVSDFAMEVEFAAKDIGMLCCKRLFI